MFIFSFFFTITYLVTKAIFWLICLILRGIGFLLTLPFVDWSDKNH